MAKATQNVTHWSRITGHTSGGWTAQIVFVSALQRLLDAVSLGFANGRLPARLPSVQSGASLAEVGA